MRRNNRVGERVEMTTYELFNVFEKFVEIDESEFTFDVSVFTQVSPGVRFLCSERLLNAEDISQTRETGFEVELRGLGEVSLFSVVIESEQSGSSFDLSLNHTGRSNFEQVEVGVGLTER